MIHPGVSDGRTAAAEMRSLRRRRRAQEQRTNDHCFFFYSVFCDCAACDILRPPFVEVGVQTGELLQHHLTSEGGKPGAARMALLEALQAVIGRVLVRIGE